MYLKTIKLLKFLNIFSIFFKALLFFTLVVFFGLSVANSVKAAEYPHTGLSFGNLLPSNAKNIQYGISKEDALSVEFQILVNLPSVNPNGASGFVQGDCLKVENVCFPIKSLFIGAVSPKSEVGGVNAKCFRDEYVDLWKAMTSITTIIPGNSFYTYCNNIAVSEKIPVGNFKFGEAQKVRINWDKSAREAQGANVSSDDGSALTNGFTAYLFFDIDLSLAPDTNIRVDGTKHTVAVRVFNSKAQADSFNQSPESQNGVNQTQNCGLNCGTVEGTKPATLLDLKDTLYGFLVKLIGYLFVFINYLLHNVFWYFVAPILQATLAIQTYSDAFANVIYPGWELLRNLANIFFIISLIFIALATLFRLESYNYKHLLVNLILAALLVNFSLVIAQAVLGVADTVQNQFLPNNIEIIRELGTKLMTEPTYQIVNGQSFTEQLEYGNTATVIQLFFMASLSIGAFLTFLGIAAMLVVRVVMLWVLLMVSPAAYFGSVLPFAKEFTEEWWSYFLKYAFFTPVMAFFLNMAASIVENHSRVMAVLSSGGLEKGASALSQGSQYPQFTDFLLRSASAILLLVFLIAGLKIADRFGVLGATTLSRIVQGGMTLPFVGAGAVGAFGARKGFSLAARKWNEITANKIAGHDAAMPWYRRALFTLTNPVAWWKGRSKRIEELEEEARHLAEAKGLMVSEQNKSRGNKVIDRANIVEKHSEDEALKDMQGKSKEELYNMADKIVGLDNSNNGRASKRAIIKSILAGGYLDDLIQDGTRLKNSQLLAKMRSLDNEYKILDSDFYEADEVGADGQLTGQKVKKLKYNDKTMRAALLSFFDKNDQTAWRMINDDGDEFGRRTHHYEYLTLGNFDPDTGRHHMYGYDPHTGQFNSAVGHAQGHAYAATEINKIDNSRQRAGVAPHTLFAFDDNGTVYENEFRKFASAAYENAAFMQGRMWDFALASGKSVDVYVDSTTGMLQNLSEADIKRINNMNNIDSRALAALYLKATGGDATAKGVDTYLKANSGIRIKKGDGTYAEVKFNKPRVSSVQQQAIETEDSPVRVSKRVEVERAVTNEANQVFPNYNRLISAIEGVQDAVTNGRSGSGQVASKIVEIRASQNAGRVDIMKHLDNDPKHAELRIKLAPQELQRLGETLRLAVQKGFSKASYYDDEKDQVDAIYESIRDELKKDSTKKEFGGRDWSDNYSGLNIQKIAKAIVNEIKSQNQP